jgi:uncharacterized protein YbjT (DUF2867 family)
VNVLVTGATGNVGSAVVRELAERGVPFRALVRDPDAARSVLGDGVPLAVGDFGDPGSLRAALEGVERLFLACGNVPGQVAYEGAAIDAAREAGVRRIVKLSAAAAAVDSPLLFPRWQGEIEAHLHGSGVQAVVLRPAYSMANLLLAADAVAATGTLVAPAGGARIAMIHPADVGAAAAVALTGDGHDGEAYVLTGPEAITYERVAADLSAATGRDVAFVDVSDAAAREGMLAHGMPEPVAAFLVGMFRALRDGADARVTTTVRDLTGREPRPFAAFARERAAAFGAGQVTVPPGP